MNNVSGQKPEDARGGLLHVALMVVLDRLGNDGRGNAGDRKVANGGVNVALEGARRYGELRGGISRAGWPCPPGH